MIYFLSKEALSDHCSMCGGEEHEGNTGDLKRYLVVYFVFDEGNYEYDEQNLCDKCRDKCEGIKNPS